MSCCSRGIEPVAVLRDGARSALAFGHVEAGYVARPARQRRESIGRAQVLQIERDLAVPPQQLRDLRHRVAVARVQAQGRAALRHHPVDLQVELGGDVFELGQEPGNRTRLGPHQLLAQRGQPRTASLLQLHQGTAKELRPFRDDVPGVAIGQIHPLGGQSQLPGFVHGVQQREQLVIDLLPGFVAEDPGRANLDSLHMQSGAYCCAVSMLLALHETVALTSILMHSDAYSGGAKAPRNRTR